jgi:putative protein-disulfide isomerase
VIELCYVHDPLCGWCFAMHPALSALEQCSPFEGRSLTTLNAILWGGTSARIMGEGFRAHLEHGMPRVEQSSSVRFGSAFHENIVADDHYVYESSSAARALQVVKLHAPTLHLEYILRLQTAFFDGGASASDVRTHVRIGAQLGIAPRTFVDTYYSELVTRHVQAERVRARSEMAAMGANGVPLFFARQAGRTVRIEHERARSPEDFAQRVTAALDRLGAGCAAPGDAEMK